MSTLEKITETLIDLSIIDQYVQYIDEVSFAIDRHSSTHTVTIKAIISDGYIVLSYDFDDKMKIKSSEEISAIIRNFDNPSYDFFSDPEYHEAAE